MARKKKEEIVSVESENNNILLQNKVEIDSIRDELKGYVDEQINKGFFDELEKTNKKLIREKSKKIFWKNVIIILLLLIIGFLVYLLYSNNYFDKYFNKENNTSQKEEKKEEKKDVEPTPSPTPTPTATPKKPTQEELKKEYAHLLDNYYVSDSSIYLVDYYDGKLTDDMKKYMTLNSFDFSTLEKEEDYNIIKEATFKQMYEKLFDSEYSSSTFEYDENKVRFVKGMESYMTTSILVRDESNIEREIKEIKEDNNTVTITTVEGVVKDNKLYNIISNDEVTEYKGDSLIKYENKLHKVVYTFKDNKLISLGK